MFVYVCVASFVNLGIRVFCGFVCCCSVGLGGFCFGSSKKIDLGGDCESENGWLKF